MRRPKQKLWCSLK